MVDISRLETLKKIAFAAAKDGSFSTLIFSAEDILELLDEIDRLNVVIYQGNHMNFKDL